MHVVAGPDFGPLQVHALIINKSFHGLRTSGLLWHGRSSDCVLNMGFEPRKMEPEMYLKDCGDHYYHIAVHVDDLFI